MTFNDIMPRLERLWDEGNRTPVLAVSAGIISVIAIVDWWTKPYVSLGFLYLFPIMLAAAFLPRWLVAVVGAGCAFLAEIFSSLTPSFIRLDFETLALAGCGLFVGELVRNRRLNLEAQEQLKALVETSPAAIVTVDDNGMIELANRAAVEMMAPRNGRLAGHPISAFLPELHHAVRWEEAPQFRASMQCRAHRGNGESFTADVWFSTYKIGRIPKLAAIVADITEEGAGAETEAVTHVPNAAPSDNFKPPTLNNRETEVLRFLVQGLTNKEIAFRLEISDSAVKNTMQQLFAKTGCRSRSQLVRVALRSLFWRTTQFRYSPRTILCRNRPETRLRARKLAVLLDCNTQGRSFEKKKVTIKPVIKRAVLCVGYTSPRLSFPR